MKPQLKDITNETTTEWQNTEIADWYNKWNG